MYMVSYIYVHVLYKQTNKVDEYFAKHIMI